MELFIVFQNFLEELYLQGASKKTIDAYKKDLVRFNRWYEKVNNRELLPVNITGIDLREYQNYLQVECELKPATVNRYLISINRWLVWAKDFGYIEKVPPFPKQVALQKRRPKSLEQREQINLLRKVEYGGNTRDLALVRVLLGCGLRVSEAISLKISDLEFEQDSGKITVRKGKGNKWREVPVPAATRLAVQNWLLEIKNKYPGCFWLFPNRKGRHISARYAELLVMEMGRQAGIKCTPHTLRHTCATNMLQAGVDLVTVAEILGHSSLDTTAIYTKPSDKIMLDAVEKGEINRETVLN